MSAENTIISYFANSSSEEKFIPNTDGKLSSSILQSWTPQAISCYNLKCDCTKCEISQFGFSFVCQMKSVVEELLKQGKPTNVDYL